MLKTTVLLVLVPALFLSACARGESLPTPANPGVPGMETALPGSMQPNNPAAAHMMEPNRGRECTCRHARDRWTTAFLYS